MTGNDTFLVLGTTNAGKVRELVDLLAPFAIACRSLADVAGAVDVEESGSTFAENAALKASLQARALGRWVLAEDSGLVVPALQGAPGVYSARFSGPQPPGDTRSVDARNNALLLDRLSGHSGGGRAAHYACHAALADPSGRIMASAAGTINQPSADQLLALGVSGVTADNLANISSNQTQSRSTIVDTDYAIATTELAKTQIIQQASTAMLAQANQQAQSVMALLK